MILRLLRASLLPQDVPAVFAALRAEADQARDWSGMVGWTHGLRWSGPLVRGITVSAWNDFDALLRVARGNPERDVSSVSDTGLLRDVHAEHYELTEAVDPARAVLDGEAIGVVWGRIRPNVESGVQDMVRAIRPSVEAAGVQALYAGRRITDEGTEIAVVAVWRDRLSLHAFARSRPTGAIDPAFSSQLEPWLFETYDCLPPDRLTIPPTGPATLVVDEAGRCVDATPGVEGVLGMPGELLIGKGLGEVLDGTSRGVLDEALGADRTASVRLRMMPWPGTATEVAAEIDGDVRRDGLRTITLRSVEAGVTAGERRTIPA